MLLLFLSVGMTWAQNSLLTQQKLAEIKDKATTDAEKENCYTADAIRQFLNYYKIDGYALPNSFPNRDDEKKVVKFMQKVCDKGKTANDSDKKLWKPYYTAFLIEIYTQEAELIAQREKEEQKRQDSIVRNNWSSSNTWKTLQYFCNYDYSLNDSLKFYSKFIKENGLNIDSIYYLDCVSNYTTFGYPDSISWAGSKYIGYHSVYKFVEDSLYKNYETILREINYKPNIPVQYYERGHERILHSLFLQDKMMVNELQHLKRRFTELDASNQRKLWAICNAYYFRQRVNNWINTSQTNLSTNGTIHDTVELGHGDMGIISIPYIVENGVIIPHGTCTIRQFDPQYKDATGARYNKITVDITLTVIVDKGKATNKTVKGYVCEWNENTAAGKGKKNYFEQKKAIQAAKPIEVEKIIINKEDDIKNNLTLKAYGIDMDDMISVLTYGCTKELWKTIGRLYTNDDAWVFIKTPKSKSEIMMEYLKTGRDLYLELAKRPFAPIDFSNLP